MTSSLFIRTLLGIKGDHFILIANACFTKRERNCGFDTFDSTVGNTKKINIFYSK